MLGPTRGRACLACKHSIRFISRPARAISSLRPPRTHHLEPPIVWYWHPAGTPSGGGLRIRITGTVSVFVDEQARISWQNMPKAGFYAVAAGRQPGIYSTWAECEAQVKGYAGGKYKKFSTRTEAEAFVGSSARGAAPGAGAGAGPGAGKPYSRQPPSRRNSARPSSADSSTGRPAITTRSAESRMTIAPTSSLPTDLQVLAAQGYTFTEAPHHLIVYTDGSSLDNGKATARAGLGVYWGSRGEAAEWNISERVPGEPQTNNRGELLSVVRALERCPHPNLPLEVRTDSKYTIGCMTQWLHKWIKNDFVGVKNAEMIKHLLVLLQRRGPKAHVRFRHVYGHMGEEGNEAADKLARGGSAKPRVPARTDWLSLDQAHESQQMSQVEVEMDESWFMTEDELNALEQEIRA